jgi:Phosphotransferase enzyme family
MVAAHPHQGGATWAVLQYVLGLTRLGYEVFLVEQVEEPDAAVRSYFEAVAARYGLRAALVAGRDRPPFVEHADVLLNLSGALRHEASDAIPVRVYVDLDPAFNQLWHEEGIDVGFEGHTHFVTVGQAVPDNRSLIPSCGREWLATLPPVVLDRWPVAGASRTEAFTTVANWRGYGSIVRDGVHYGQKAHSLRKLLAVPARTGERFELALGIHPDETRDLEALAHNGWTVLDPRAVAGTPQAYSEFVRGSRAEFGVAKSGYVVSRSGWFSDRSACYLASGRPVLAEDTGFSAYLPTGAGLFAFRDVEEVAAAAGELRRDYGRHARAARAIAEEFLDSDRVLTRLLSEIGIGEARYCTVHEATDAELARALGGSVSIARRRPSAYRSTAPIAEVDAVFRGGRVQTLIVKDLSRGAPTERARRARPAFLVDPRREIVVYRDVLAHSKLGTPRLYAWVEDALRERYWLVIEKVAAVELYQLGELDAWRRVLRWLAGLHSTFAGRDLPSSLIRYDAPFLGLWLGRARRHGDLAGLELFPGVVAHLASLPPTFVHGELYASNVLVASERVCPIDWEMAGSGPGVLDVAAITMGWEEEARNALVEEYRAALRPIRDRVSFDRDLDCARFYLAVQWLGWEPGWSPPPDHRRDFAAELDELAGRVAT